MVIPTYLRPQGLIRTLLCLVQQTHEDWRAVIVHQDPPRSSRDWPLAAESMHVAQTAARDHERISLISSSPPSSSRARTTGRAALQGPNPDAGSLFAWWDDDDEIPQHYMAAFVYAYKHTNLADDDAWLGAGWWATCDLVETDGKIVRTDGHEDAKGACFATPCVVMDSSVALDQRWDNQGKRQDRRFFGKLQADHGTPNVHLESVRVVAGRSADGGHRAGGF